MNTADQTAYYSSSAHRAFMEKAERKIALYKMGMRIALVIHYLFLIWFIFFK